MRSAAAYSWTEWQVYDRAVKMMTETLNRLHIKACSRT